MRHNILIIDDEYSDRRDAYDKLAEEIRKRYPGFEVVFLYQEKDDKSDLLIKLRDNQFSAVITDAVLTGKWEKLSIRNVVEIIPDATPIAVVSSRWDETNAQEMRYAWANPNCRTFLHWRDIDTYKSEHRKEQDPKGDKSSMLLSLSSICWLIERSWILI